MNEQQWVLEAVRFYRPMDFFSEYSSLTDEQLAEELIARNAKTQSRSYLERFLEAKEEAAKEHEEWEFVTPEAFADMCIVSEDTSRVWWDDGEVDIYPQGATYIKFLQDCSRISRGSFIISNIEEEWEDEMLEGVTFDFNGDRWRVVPDQLYGWIDFEILDQVNSFIADSGYKFLGHPTGDQTTFLIVLTDAEKQKFEAERQWSFFDSFGGEEE